MSEKTESTPQEGTMIVCFCGEPVVSDFLPQREVVCKDLCGD